MAVCSKLGAVSSARHTAATQLAFDGVAPAVIAAWIGHTDAAFAMKLYTHSHPEALKAAGGHFRPGCDNVVTPRPGIEQVEQRMRCSEWSR